MEDRALPLHVLTWGNGPRRILLLHGLSSSAAGWWRVAGDLAERGWRVAAPDLRGHGESPAGDDYRFSSYAADLLALGTGWDAVVGHSLGGALAVVAATARPGWTRGLILQDPGLMMVETGRGEIARRLLDAYEPPISEEAIALRNPRWRSVDCRIKAEALRSSSRKTVRGTLEGNRSWNLLAEASVPPAATVVLGSDPAEGGIVAISIGEWLADRPGVEYRVLAGAGHSPHREDDVYDMYLEAVLEALERLPALETERGTT